MDKKVLIIFIGRVLQIGISLLSVRVFTSFLAIAEVGNLYLINTILGFFGFVLVNPVGMYMNRKMHRWAEERSIINNFFIFNTYLLILSVSSIVVIYIGHDFFHVGGTIGLGALIIFVGLSLYFNTWNQTIIPTLNLLNHRISFVIFTVLTLSVGLCLSIGIIRYVDSSAIHWLTGQLIAQMVVTFLAFRYFRKVIKGDFSFRHVRTVVNRRNFVNILYFAIPLSLATFLMWAQNQSYRMIIENTIGLEFLGLIGLGMAISSSIAVAVESLVHQLYYPVFYSEINTYDQEKRTEAWNKMAQLTFPIYISLTLLVSFLAPYLVNILASERFNQAFMFVVYGSWIELFRMTTNILSSVAHSEMQTKYLIKAYLAGGLTAIFGVYLGTKHQYYQQIIPAVLVASGFVTTLIMYVDMTKIMKMKVGIRRIIQSIFLSLPFSIAVLFYPLPKTIGMSLFIVFVSGIYFLLIQYRISWPLLKGDSL